MGRGDKSAELSSYRIWKYNTAHTPYRLLVTVGISSIAHMHIYTSLIELFMIYIKDFYIKSRWDFYKMLRWDFRYPHLYL